MRCRACNTILEDAELTRKDPDGCFYDLCNVCFNSSQACEWDDDSFFDDYQKFYLTLSENSDTLY
jgi:hypothetical protein